MKITNRHNLPAGFVKASASLVEKHNAPGTLSATTLLQGVKQIILTDRHWEELEDDVSDRIWAIFGSAVHSLMESEGEHDFSEQKISFKVGDISVTGTIDNYDMQNGIVYDYKTASVTKIKFKDFSDWHTQGMIYAWLLTKNKFPVNKCRFIALLKDHSKTDAMRDSQYPKDPVFIFEFQVTQQALFKIGLFIREKIGEYQRCVSLKDDAIPPCSPEERWDRQPKYAVMKTGAKRAVRLFDRQKDAEQLAEVKGNSHYVEFRKGESKRCMSYCLCCRFCNFYRQSVIPEQLEPYEMQSAA